MGVVHPRYLLPQLTASDLNEWLAYFVYIEEEREKARELAKTRQSAGLDPAPKKQSQDQQKDMMLKLAHAMGAKVVKRKKK